MSWKRYKDADAGSTTSQLFGEEVCLQQKTISAQWNVSVIKENLVGLCGSNLRRRGTVPFSDLLFLL